CGTRVRVVRIRSSCCIFVHMGQYDRKLVLGQRGGVAFLVVDDRERLAPVALSGEQPVTQFVLDGSAAVSVLLQPVDDTLRCRGDVQSVQAELLVCRVDRQSVAGVRPTGEIVGRLYGTDDIQPELRREVPITLVLAGYS